MRRSATLIVAVLWAAQFGLDTAGLKAQEVVKEGAYELGLPTGWTRARKIPQGFDVGFRKALRDGQEATLFLHCEAMPPEAGEPPSDTSDMERQWDTIVGNQYPDVRSVVGTVPKVGGKILISRTYELTDDGQKVRRRYTYFLAGRTAFAVQCSASPTQWASVLIDFDAMLASLKPGGSSSETQTKSDAWAMADLKQKLSTLLGSFPSRWNCSLSEAAIISSLPEDKRTLEIALSFDRPDIGEIYKATKTVFGMIKAGKSDSDLNSLPAETLRAASNSAEFVKYVGQVWGMAWGSVSNCHPAIERYRLPILDSNGRRIGAMSISREDGSAVLTGKITASDAQKVASMYVFE